MTRHTNENQNQIRLTLREDFCVLFEFLLQCEWFLWLRWRIFESKEENPALENFQKQSCLTSSSSASLYSSIHFYCLAITPQARIILSVYPANSVCPSALHAKLTHSGSRDFFPTLIKSGFNSSTLLFFSRSKMMMDDEVAAHSQ